VALFRRESLRIVADLRAASGARDVRALLRLGHDLLGSSGMIGAERVAACARALQEATRTDDFVTVAQSLPDLERAIVDTHRALSRAFAPLAALP